MWKKSSIYQDEAEFNIENERSKDDELKLLYKLKKREKFFEILGKILLNFLILIILFSLFSLNY